MQRVLDDKAFDCIVVIDFYGIIRGVNTTLVRTFGYEEKQDLIGDNVTVLMDPKVAEHHDKYLAKFREKHESGEKMSRILGTERLLQAMRKDGSEFRCIIGIHDIEETELLVGYIRNIDQVVQPPEEKKGTSWKASLRHQHSC